MTMRISYRAKNSTGAIVSSLPCRFAFVLVLFRIRFTFDFCWRDFSEKNSAARIRFCLPPCYVYIVPPLCDEFVKLSWRINKQNPTKILRRHIPRHRISIWHASIAARAVRWLSGVTPAQQSEWTIIDASGNAALQIIAFEITQISVHNPARWISSGGSPPLFSRRIFGRL